MSTPEPTILIVVVPTDKDRSPWRVLGDTIETPMTGELRVYSGGVLTLVVASGHWLAVEVQVAPLDAVT